MKTIFTFLFVFASYVINAQNYYLNKSHDFAVSDTFANQLFTLDNKPNSLFLLKVLNTEPINLGEPLLRYFLYESISGGEFQQLTIPSIDYIISRAAKTTIGAMFQVISEDHGQELLFFDGNQFTVLDLIPGENGSHGFVNVKDDRAFITRYSDENYTHWELHEFIDVNNIVQISDSYESYFCNIQNVFGDTVVYSVHDVNGTKLMTTTFDNGNWTQEEIWSSSASISILGSIGLINDKFIFAVLESEEFVPDYTYRVVVIDNATGNTSILLQEEGDFSFDFQWKSFQFNNQYYYPSNLTNSMFTTSNGVDVNQVLSASEGRLIQHSINENSLYFLVEKVSGEDTIQRLLKNVNFQNQIIYAGNKVNIIVGPDELYLIEKSYASSNVSALLKVMYNGSILDWTFNNNYETFIYNSTYFADNGAIVQNNLYFIFTEKLPSDSYDTDIYFLQPIGAVSGVDQSNFTFYPNPVSNGQSINLTTELLGEYKILNAQGAEILTGNVITHKQTIDLPKLSSGIYFFNFNNSMRKFVVN